MLWLMKNTFLINQWKIMKEHAITFQILQMVTGFFLGYPYFKKHYKMSKRQEPDADPKTIQQLNFDNINFN